jgi:hypothetical protein
MDGFPIQCKKEEEVKEKLLSYQLLYHGPDVLLVPRESYRGLIPPESDGSESQAALERCYSGFRLPPAYLPGSVRV